MSSEDKQTELPASEEGSAQGPMEPQAPKARPAKSQKPKSRLRWLWRSLWALLALLVIARFALPYALPSLLDSVLADYGLEAQYDELDLSVLGLAVELRHFELRERSEDRSGDLHLRLDYLQADLSALALLTGGIHVKRLELEGFELHVHRNRQGQLVLAERLANPSSPPGSEDKAAADPIPSEPVQDSLTKPAEHPPQATDPAPEEAIDLSLPFRIDELHLSQMRLRVHDESVQPAIDTWVDAHLRMHHLGDPERPAKLSVLISGDQLVDRLSIEGRFDAEAKEILAKLQIQLEGLHPHAAASWLQVLGIEPLAEDLDADVELRLRSWVPAERPSCACLDLSLHGLRLMAGGTEQFALDQVQVTSPELSAQRQHFSKISLRGLRAQATRRLDGALDLAGLTLKASGGQVEVKQEARVAESAQEQSPQEHAPSASSPEFFFDLIELRQGRILLIDKAVQPQAEFALALDEFGIRDLATPGPGRDGQGQVQLQARMPGLAESLRLRGRVEPFGPAPRAQLELSLSGMGLQRLGAHLRAAGLEALPGQRQLTLQLDAGVDASEPGAPKSYARLHALHLRLGEKSLLRLEEVGMAGLQSIPRGTRIDELCVRGLAMPVARQQSGNLEFLGFRTLSQGARAWGPGEDALRVQGEATEIRSEAQTGAHARSPSHSKSGDSAFPRLEIGRFCLEKVQVPLIDHSVTPRYETGLGQLRIQLEDLALGGDASQDAPGKALLHGELRLGDIARKIRLSGTIETQPGPLALRSQLDLQAEPIDLRELKPYLASQGIEPKMERGKLALQLHAQVQTAESGLRVAASLEDLILREAEAEPLLSLKRAAITGLHPSAKGLRIAEILISEPTIRASRNKDAGLELLGLRILPQSPKSAQSAMEKAAAAKPTAGKSTAAKPTSQNRAKTPGVGASTAGLRIERIALEGGRVLCSDAHVREEVLAFSAGFTAELRQFEIGAKAAPARIELALELPGNLDKLSVRGQASLRPGALSTQLALRGSGLRQGTLSAYLPAGMTSTLRDGRFAADFEARLLDAEEGGQRLEATLSQVSLHEAQSQDALFAIARARVIAPRLDAEAAQFEIQELSLSGTELLVTRHPEGVHELFGLRIDPKAAETPSAETSTETSTEPPSKAAAKAAPQPSSSGYRLASEVSQTPALAIQNFSLEFARLRLVDHSGEVVAPPIDTRLRIYAPEALLLSSPEEEHPPPVRLRVEGAAEPLIGNIGAELSATLQGTQAQIQMQVGIEEIHGNALASHLPFLGEGIDASAIQNGSLTGRLETELQLHQRNDLDFDLSRGFGIEAQASDIALRARPEGEILAGVGRVYLLAPRILLSGKSKISRIEIDEIVGRVRQSKEGIEVLGIQFKRPGAAPKPPSATSKEPSPQSPSTTKPANAPPQTRSAQPSAAQIDIDVISVSGLDFDVIDETTDPVTYLPLQDLGMEINGLSTRALSEPLPIRFHVSLSGGDVELPKTHRASSLVMGILSSATSAVTGAGNKVQREKRPFLQDLSARGQLLLYPHPFGRVRTSIAKLELLALRGMAKKSGVEIGGGVLDSGLRLEFRGEKGLDLSTRFTFENLQMDEPPGGPISSYLKLPAPLNAVIFALKDQNDQVCIPANVHIAEGKIGTGQISAAIITAIGSLVTDAIAAMPLRAAGAVTGAIGLGNLFGSSERDLEALKQELDFAPAATAISAKNQPALAQISDLLEGDEELGIVLVHQFGKADLKRAMLLANPAPTQTRALVQRLRLRKAKLSRQRESKGAQLRAIIHIGNEQQVQLRVRELQALDRQLGETETALDKALALLAPGAARRAPQRALDLARALAQERMEQIRSQILQRIGAEQSERIELRTPRIKETQREGGGLVLIAPRVRNTE
ncbi:MAG: hypothetical protein CSA62_00665 [Planctomycetota bacterium]|nr:MAG: hypothetical protein CSA62_00665 [Planctomycetota bacterium]